MRTDIDLATHAGKTVPARFYDIVCIAAATTNTTLNKLVLHIGIKLIKYQQQPTEILTHQRAMYPVPD